MKEIIINFNDEGQRIDRFLKKYLSRASTSFIYKMIRKKNIKLNGNKVKPEEFIKQGDKIQIYFSDETLLRMTEKKSEKKKQIDLNIVFEDENIILINKPSGMLTHSVTGDYHEKDVVSGIVNYLYEKREYVPRKSKTFRPSVVNRLDRNTSGLIIGAKNYESLKEMNRLIREKRIKKYYKTIILGNISNEVRINGYLKKYEKKNKVKINNKKMDDSDKEIDMIIYPLLKNEKFSTIKVDLITGRTHQIRAGLLKIGHPIIGDRKYGNKRVNLEFKEKFRVENQILHAFKIKFGDIDGKLSYLKNQKFEVENSEALDRIEKDLFNIK